MYNIILSWIDENVKMYYENWTKTLFWVKPKWRHFRRHQRFNNTCSDGQAQYLKVLLVIYAHYGGWGRAVCMAKVDFPIQASHHWCEF